MKVMLYNVYRGALGREHQLEEVVARQSPDLLLLTETNGWHKRPDIVDSLQRAGGFSDFFLIPTNTDYSLAMFAKGSIASHQTYHDGFWHGAGVAKITTPHGTLSCLLTHLTPKPEVESRVREAQAITQIAQSEGVDVIAGDFNALSPLDPYDRTALLGHLQEREIRKFGAKELSFHELQVLYDAHYVDAAGVMGNFTATVPTPLATEDVHAYPLRLDYFLLNQQVNLNNYEVIRNSLTDVVSDHYPVLVSLRFGD